MHGLGWALEFMKDYMGLLSWATPFLRSPQYFPVPWGSPFWSSTQKLGDLATLFCHTLPRLGPCSGPSSRRIEREKKQWGLTPPSWDHSSSDPRASFPFPGVLALARLMTDCYHSSCVFAWGLWHERKRRKKKTGNVHALWPLGIPFFTPRARTKGHLLEVSVAQTPLLVLSCVRLKKDPTHSLQGLSLPPLCPPGPGSFRWNSRILMKYYLKMCWNLKTQSFTASAYSLRLGGLFYSLNFESFTVTPKRLLVWKIPRQHKWD